MKKQNRYAVHFDIKYQKARRRAGEFVRKPYRSSALLVRKNKYLAVCSLRCLQKTAEKERK